ncbi:MAG: hypothetical protein EXR83_00660 [Gammaproteobacteria bacterium]|nr:hypothetical protein [Gammaproteobacteria bacterium]
MRLRLLGCWWSVLVMAAAPAWARNYPLTGEVIGEVTLTTTVRNDTIADIARTYGQGYNEMRRANPNVDPWLTGEDTEILIPSQYVLPKAPHEGIIINIPEMRLYHYLPAAKGAVKGALRQVATYPISIGRQDWSTPHGATKVMSKIKDPSWTPPESIRQEHAKEGDILPVVVPAGPLNPLGQYALRLGFAGYLIHGTDKPYGIGMRVTHGCMRMYPNDIETVFKSVPVGTTVRLVNEPFKVGILTGRLLLEAHPALDEDAAKVTATQFTAVLALILPYTEKHLVSLDWQMLRRTVYRKDGLPTQIGTATPLAPPPTALTLNP